MTSIKMPQLGETIIEGTILKWLKQEGDTVAADEPLFEISTDKVDTEVPSPVSGVVSSIIVPEGATVAVGTELAVIDGAEESAGTTPAQEPASAAAPPVAAAPATPAPAPTEMATAAAASAPGALPDRGPRSQILSPLVRRLASEHQVDLSFVAGTGTGGRITKQDVMAAVASGGAAPSTATPTGTSAAAAVAPAVAPPPVSAPAPAVVEPAPMPAVAGADEEIVPMTHIRKAIAQHMVGSLQVSARAWTMVEVNVDHLVKLRDRAKDAFTQRHGVKLTYLPMVTRAVTEALLEYPMVNAELRGDDLIVRRYVNMGIAVSYDEGLIVPVIRNADAMNVPGLARAIADLAARARAHQLKPDEVTGATFTITNPGPYGSLLSVPIISQPNSGILSLDAIQRRPVVVDDAIAIRSMVYVSMSWDHRVIDGELATRFLGRVKQNLETWDFAGDLGV
jgi:2-oxoglutarate dehydrogenase complex dihydrolipoamide succinyltransferase (E2) component